MHVVAQCEAKEKARLQRAGAVVVARGTFGGRRMANEILSPHITGFMDKMLEDTRGVRVEALLVREGAALAGLSLLEADLVGRLGIRPLALRSPGERRFLPVPGSDRVLEPGTQVLAVVARDEMEEIEKLLGGLA
jgi:Trk K+ transport system NAD-binding subunit